MLLSIVPYSDMALMWQKLKFTEFQCILRKPFFTVGKVKHWQVLSREVQYLLGGTKNATTHGGGQLTLSNTA